MTHKRKQRAEEKPTPITRRHVQSGGCLGFLEGGFIGGVIGGVIGYYGVGFGYLAYSKLTHLPDNPQIGILFVAAGLVGAIVGSIVGAVILGKRKGHDKEQ